MRRKGEDSISKDFYNYANPSNNLIEAAGMEKMGNCLGIDIYEDLFLIFFMYKCGCKKLESITLLEYTNGLNYFNVSKLADLKKKLKNYERCLTYTSTKNSDLFGFYKYLYTINQDRQKKKIDFAFVEVYLNKIFNCYKPLIQFLLSFLKDVKKVKEFTNDEWITFFDFFDQLGTSFPKGYSVAGAWSVILDEFYYYYMKTKNLTIPPENAPENYYANS